MSTAQVASSSRSPAGFSNTGSKTMASFGSEQGSMDSAFSSLSNLFAAIANCLLINEVRDVHDENIALSESYYQVALQDFQFWTANYRPRMLSIAQSVVDPLQNPVIPVDYAGTVGASISKAHRQADQAWFATRRITPRYNVGSMKWADVKNLEQRHTAAVGYGTFGYRYEQVRAELFDERRIARIIEVMNIGIDGGAIASAGLASAVQAVQEQNVDALNAKKSLVSAAVGIVGAVAKAATKAFVGGG